MFSYNARKLHCCAYCLPIRFWLSSASCRRRAHSCPCSRANLTSSRCWARSFLGWGFIRYQASSFCNLSFLRLAARFQWSEALLQNSLAFTKSPLSLASFAPLSKYLAIPSTYLVKNLRLICAACCCSAGEFKLELCSHLSSFSSV